MTKVSVIQASLALAARTGDAYSFGRYASWPAVCAALLRRGYDDKQVEAIVRSKWTRWAADASNKPHGKATSNDLLRWMDKLRDLQHQVEELTRETFPEEQR